MDLALIFLLRILLRNADIEQILQDRNGVKGYSRCTGVAHIAL